MLLPDKEQSRIALKEEKGQDREEKGKEVEKRKGRKGGTTTKKKGMVSYSEDAL